MISVRLLSFSNQRFSRVARKGNDCVKTVLKCKLTEAQVKKNKIVWCVLPPLGVQTF